MIVAVEGTSAAGKTSWCRATNGPFVAEYVSSGTEPREDPVVEAAYWVEVDSRRWTRALALEATDGHACCDSDPVKLHYSWCLAAVGEGPWARFEAEAELTRRAFVDGRLGLADAVVLLDVDDRTLRARKEGDTSRRRRSFDLHLRLREPLLAWYAAVEDVDPGRVVRNPPVGLDPLRARGSRPDRSDPLLLDTVLRRLPAL